MKLFLSWSGETSQKVAGILRAWVPSVIQAVKPYISSSDLEKGALWFSEIATELQGTNFGIVVVTRTNQDAPWINFEAGALAKAMDKARVAPVLFRMKKSDVKGPLAQWQMTLFEYDEIYKLMQSINGQLTTGQLDEITLKETFKVWWPKLEEELAKVEDEDSATSDSSDQPAQNAILEELLELARTQQRLLRSPEEILPPQYVAMVLEANELTTRRGIEFESMMEMMYDELHSMERMCARLREMEGSTLQSEELSAFVSRTQERLRMLARRNPSRRAIDKHHLRRREP